MWFLKKKVKVHEDEPFLIAHILRGSGSISSLLHFINTHPGGADAARKDIIKIKYWYSKCTPIVQNIVRKMVKKFELFDVEKCYVYGIYNNDLHDRFTVIDREKSLRFRVASDVYEIEIPNGGKLSTNEYDWQLFLYATRSVNYIKNNINEMRESQKRENKKRTYIAAYK